MRFQGLFRNRTANQRDLDTLLETVNVEFRRPVTDETVQEMIHAIRASYLKRIGTDATLRIRLQYHSTDFLVVKLEFPDEDGPENA